MQLWSTVAAETTTVEEGPVGVRMVLEAMEVIHAEVGVQKEGETEQEEEMQAIYHLRRPPVHGVLLVRRLEALVVTTVRGILAVVIDSTATALLSVWGEERGKTTEVLHRVC